MRYGLFILALGGLWSSQVSAGELQSAGRRLHCVCTRSRVGTENGYPTYGAPSRVPGPPRTRRVMWHQGRYTEHRHTMKDIDQGTRRLRPTLTTQSTPTLAPKNFRRGPLPYAIQRRCALFIQPNLWSVRILARYDKGRFR